MTNQKPTDCASFVAGLYAFQADELPGAERADLQEHLNHCAGCQRRLEVEESFRRVLRRRLAGPPAPAQLKRRIREGLAASASRRRSGLAGWLLRPGMAGAAAALLLALVMAVSLDPTGSGLADPTDIVTVSRVATIVDIDCDQAGFTPEQQRNCRSARHVNGLKVADGDYWKFDSGQAEGRRLMLDRDARGARVNVRGEYFTGLATIRLTDIRPVAPVGI